MEILKKDHPENKLPKDGVALYYGPLLSIKQANHYFNAFLKGIAWEHDELLMFGKKIITKRKVGWYGEKPYKYTYSNSSKHALPWTPELLQVKAIVEKVSGETYNSCLLNLYHTGSEGMGWHSDDEKELKRDAAIASLSLGAQRKFVFKHKASGEKVSVLLEDGSLLVMKAGTQTHWLHSLPPTTRIWSARINLTFRTIKE